MKEILEGKFGQYYGSTKTVPILSRCEKGVFTISDTKACGQCSKEYEQQCNHVVSIVNAKATEVCVVELETFLNKYDNLKAIPLKKKCDLLMYSDDKVVFCDVTCSNPKYIGQFTGNGEEKIGKRQTARIQLQNSINLLCGVPEIADEIGKRNMKVALFAFREKTTTDMSEFDQMVVSSMNAFGEMQKIHFKEKMMSDMEHDFFLSEVRYPEVYEW